MGKIQDPESGINIPDPQHCYLNQVLVAAGGKWGGVGLWDAEDIGGQQNGVHLYVPHR